MWTGLSARGLLAMPMIVFALAATLTVAVAADLPSRADAARATRLRHERRDGVIVPPRQRIGADDPEYYERPLYQGPPFFYRPYYGSGPSLQWFDFGLGRDRNRFE